MSERHEEERRPLQRQQCTRARTPPVPASQRASRLLHISSLPLARCALISEGTATPSPLGADVWSARSSGCAPVWSQLSPPHRREKPSTRTAAPDPRPLNHHHPSPPLRSHAVPVQEAFQNLSLGDRPIVDSIRRPLVRNVDALKPLPDDQPPRRRRRTPAVAQWGC